MDSSSHHKPSPYSKVYGANMGPTWVMLAPDGPPYWPHELGYQGFLTGPHKISGKLFHTLEQIIGEVKDELLFLILVAISNIAGSSPNGDDVFEV